MGRKYSVGLVGESRYQAAVKRARPGEPVTLAYEPDNPHDPDAIVALNPRGEPLGYIGRDSFLQRIMHDEQGSVAAVVKAVTGGGPGRSYGIVLEVELDAGENPTVSYRGAASRGKVARVADLNGPRRPGIIETVAAVPGPLFFLGVILLVAALGQCVARG